MVLKTIKFYSLIVLFENSVQLGEQPLMIIVQLPVIIIDVGLLV